ncbi:DsrE family protein [Polynucleobacter sp. MWH-Spelu-300-X4]|uniref:DsrE family protein n=1 Tax=Polynucleobacter sp. MWH-Spelu-300-X4 TaxID=2689109 RepID=UPI001BFE8173|nr:DsrE family protein [Polynucleobacter sp. MWH-Spelu-300-X4]QWD80179.1 DsrE family protein [Polynucleobacter sp. MWH-Spelu-300-X4]
MKRLIIQLWQASLANPQLAATPFFFASAAAAMDMHVEVHVLGASVEMFIKDNPARHQTIPPMNRKLSDFIDDAVRTGVQFYACSTAMRDRQLSLEDLTDGFGEIIGMVTMLDRATQENTTVLTF